MPRRAIRRIRARAPGRGAVLLELLLSIAIFAAAATFTLSALGSALDGVRRAELRARAADLAESRLAELEAGLVAIGDLGAEASATPGNPADSDELAVAMTVVTGEASGLARVKATVTDRSGAEPVVLCERERSIAVGARERRTP
jgi:type II secretory pathway pseudopilin PulG